jgi:hypothetical protein
MTGLLIGCGGSGSSSDDNGTLSLSVFDAPVDDVAAVVVSFDGVTLKPQNGEQVYYEVTAGEIDLLSLQDGDTLILLDGITVPAGFYEWAELHITPMFVEPASGGKMSLTVPGGSLRLVGFTVTVQQNTHVGLDWNHEGPDDEDAGVVPDDTGSAGAQPLTVAIVDNMDPEAAGAWTYSIPFLDPMTYTVAFTCEEVEVLPDMDDEIVFLQAS